ncbi:MAG: toll/interleukin-1 receptor domain-containing protein [Verrucomicrobiae bacterium]|nr:toll/interleukin-1 receptor domain-containing protein [Verrucomicrobiae bacterium]
MSPDGQPKVAVSYSWKEERDGTCRGAVDAFCTHLGSRGVEVIRDTDRVRHGDSLTGFMRTIGASDFLCVFLSEAYLRSPNCMYELLIAWKRSGEDTESFRRQVKAWVMPDATGIRDIVSRAMYLDHWRAERERVKPVIERNATDGLAPGTLAEFFRIKEIADNVDAILQFIADQLSPGSAEAYRQWVDESFPDATQLAEIYAQTVSEMEALLARRQVLREFLERTTTGLVRWEGARWRLSQDVASRRFDVCPHLGAIVGGLPDFHGDRLDWGALGEWAGGLVVLAVDREWVLRSRQAARCQSAEYPADDESIGVGGGRTANLLHVAGCALAGGMARLEKVFGRPPLDEFRMPGVSKVMKGILPGDLAREIKLHFIRYILKDEPVDAGDARRIEIQFNRAKAVISAAYRDDRTPYVASGDGYRELTELIRRELKVEDLLLIHPSGDDPQGLLTDYVRALRFLWKIYEEVEARKSSRAT